MTDRGLTDEECSPLDRTVLSGPKLLQVQAGDDFVQTRHATVEFLCRLRMLGRNERRMLVGKRGNRRVAQLDRK